MLDSFKYIETILAALGELEVGESFSVTPADKQELKKIRMLYYMWGRKNPEQRSLYRLNRIGNLLVFSRKRKDPAFKISKQREADLTPLLEELLLLDEDKVNTKIEDWLESGSLTKAEEPFLRSMYRKVMG